MSLRCCPPCSLRQVGYAGQPKSPKVLHFLSPQCWDYKHLPPCPAFHMVSGIEFGSHHCTTTTIPTELPPQSFALQTKGPRASHQTTLGLLTEESNVQRAKQQERLGVTEDSGQDLRWSHFGLYFQWVGKSRKEKDL